MVDMEEVKAGDEDAYWESTRLEKAVFIHDVVCSGP